MNNRNKTGGRKKGTPNKTTQVIRIALSTIVESEIHKLPVYMAEITKPELKIELLVKLLPFILPKPESNKYEVPSELNQDKINFENDLYESPLDRMFKKRN